MPRPYDVLSSQYEILLLPELLQVSAFQFRCNVVAPTCGILKIMCAVSQTIDSFLPSYVKFWIWSKVRPLEPSGNISSVYVLALTPPPSQTIHTHK